MVDIKSNVWDDPLVFECLLEPRYVFLSVSIDDLLRDSDSTIHIGAIEAFILRSQQEIGVTIEEEKEGSDWHGLPLSLQETVSMR